MFHVLPGNFFVSLASPNRTVYWECICKLFSVMDYQLSFGIEREVVVDELQYYFEQEAVRKMRDIWCFYVLFRPYFTDEIRPDGLDNTRRTK